MQEPLRNSGDEPAYDRDPASAADEEKIGRSTLEEPVLYSRAENERLNATAERIGNAVGAAVGTMRRGLHIVPRRVDQAKERLGEAGGDLSADIRAAASDLKETARHRLFETRLKTRRYANENPFHVLGAAALSGFALGVGLRIWRWKRG